jgi:hypothetical protein
MRAGVGELKQTRCAAGGRAQPDRTQHSDGRTLRAAGRLAEHQDILEFMFEFSTRNTFGRASGVIKPQNSLNQSLKAV